MDFVKYLVLAFLQGATEFIPVSSSGHLVFFQRIFGFEQPLVFFDIVLHLATMLSVIMFLRKELLLIAQESIMAIKNLCTGKRWHKVWQEFSYFRLGLFVFIAIIPAVLAGIVLADFIEKMFSSLKVVGVSFLITGTVLFWTKYVSSKRQMKTFNFLDAFLIGIFQAVALFPGISRSGMTISAGIFRGLDKKNAARFSFILSVPTIFAAAVYKLTTQIEEIQIDIILLSLFFMVSFLSGYLALTILSRMISQAKFYYFSYYCWGIGIISLGLGFLGYV